MRNLISLLIRIIIDFLSNSKEFTINSGEGVINYNGTISCINWNESKIRLKRCELAIIGIDGIIKAENNKNLNALKRSNIILHKPSY